MSKAKTIKKEQTNPELKKLIQEKFVGLPVEGAVTKGTVLSIAKGEIRIDINGIAVGVVRGREFINISKNLSEQGIEPGSEIEVVVLDLDNENGEIDLALAGGTGSRAWGAAMQAFKKSEVISVKVEEANKGGLMASYEGAKGFIPVSQLSPEHYPRVAGGDKNKILDKLREFVGSEIKAKVLDLNESENKLIFSEKLVWEEEQKGVIEQYKIGDIVEGTVTAITPFGVFVSFGEGLEGLIHISELVWQRIDHPKDVISPGDQIKAQIIQIDGSKIFLSAKRLSEDPWRHAAEKYKTGQKVRGKVLKVNPFGLFVELDKDIHGLAHISELSDEQISDISEFAKAGDELDFEVINIEPAAHRLGLRIWGVKPKEKPPKQEKDEESDGSGGSETEKKSDETQKKIESADGQNDKI